MGVVHERGGSRSSGISYKSCWKLEYENDHTGTVSVKPYLWILIDGSYNRSTASIAAKKAEDNRTKLELKLEELREGIKTEFKAQELILEKTNTLLDKVIDLVNE
jgi:hypothetical protein